MVNSIFSPGTPGEVGRTLTIEIDVRFGICASGHMQNRSLNFSRAARFRILLLVEGADIEVSDFMQLGQVGENGTFHRFGSDFVLKKIGLKILEERALEIA